MFADLILPREVELLNWHLHSTSPTTSQATLDHDTFWLSRLGPRKGKKHINITKRQQVAILGGSEIAKRKQQVKG